jgi:hypothetical protein
LVKVKKVARTVVNAIPKKGLKACPEAEEQPCRGSESEERTLTTPVRNRYGTSHGAGV